jgi:hypothetical protein
VNDLWLVLPLIFFTNFMSIFLAIRLMHEIDQRRKRRVAEFVIKELGEKISTEMDFQKIVEQLQEQSVVNMTDGRTK